MSIFGTIMSSIFGSSATAATPGGAAAPTAAGASASGSPAAAVDVAAILDAKAEEADEELDWRRSIVDLMKLLNLDSSLSARKKLAAELNYTGDTSDSATMNVWLNKQVLAKLAANGGNVPADLLD